MSPFSAPVEISTEKLGAVTVVRFGRAVILTGERMEKAGQELYCLAENPETARLVLDFQNVEMLTSTMIGKLVMLDKKVRDAGGRLAVCNLNETVRTIFNVAQLPRILNIYADEPAALKSFESP